MGHGNDLFTRMCKEAEEDLAGGEKGTWRDIDTNTLLLACFSVLDNHLTAKIARPLWFFAYSVCAGVIGYLVKQVIGA